MVMVMVGDGGGADVVRGEIVVADGANAFLEWWGGCCSWGKSSLPTALTLF